MDGRCPLGEFDVVVGALDGPWARSVRAAWAQTGVPYAAIAPDAAASAEERLAHHVGAALAALWAGR